MLPASDPVVARGPAVGTQKAHVRSATQRSAGEPALAPVQISPQRMQEIGVTTATAELKIVSDHFSVPGNVDIDEERLSYVQTRFPGWIQNVFANATYQYVRKGQRLFTIYSPDLVSTEQEYLLARQNQQTFCTQDAHGHGRRRKAAGSCRRPRSGCGSLEFAAQAIADLEQSGKVQHEIAVESPASGYIIERNALPNAYVQPDTKLYTIADLSTVWVYANVFQNDVGRLKPGDPAQVTVDAYPGRTLQRPHRPDSSGGRSHHAHRARAAGLQQSRRRAQAGHVRQRRHRRSARPATGRFRLPAFCRPARARSPLSTTARAIWNRATSQTGPQLDDSVVVLSGLKPGDRVVSSANFLVDSEAQLQAAMGSFSPPAAQPAGGSGQRAAANSCRSTSAPHPSPPRKGANTVRVKLTGADGKPVPGAQVTVTFFMPAMPAMGMAAMRAVGHAGRQGQRQLRRLPATSVRRHLAR